MAKSVTSSVSSDGSSSYSVTSSNRISSHTITHSRVRTKDGFVDLISENTSTKPGGAFVLIKVVFVIMIALSILSTLFGRNQMFTLEHVLNALGDVPKGTLLPYFTDLASLTYITGDWGILEPIRTTINFLVGRLTTFTGFILHLGYGFFQLFSFIGYFLRLI